MEKYKRSIIVVVLLAITLPYLLALLTGGQDWVFAGFLLNPADGASYLAKMQQGFSGAWRFTLPYTAEPGSGAYLFLFYLALGHLARLLGLPLILIYHLARVVGAVALLFALFDFFAHVFPGRPDLQRIASWLAVVGSGMGWLVVFFLSTPPADFWVAEAYPFLSMYANPHFPLGLALVLRAFSLLLERDAKHRFPHLALIGLLVSIIQPFGVVIALMAAGGWFIWTWLETRCLEWQPVVSLAALGGPFLLYQFWAAQTDPVLSGWNAQNVTISPPVFDFLLSFSPAFVLALVGFVPLVRQAKNPPCRLIAAWFVLGLLLIYFPFSLQRRFMLGFYLPTVVLAVWGIDFLRQQLPALRKRLMPLVFGLSLPSTILVLLIGVFGALGHASLLYLSKDEASAMDWIRDNSPAGALVLSAPETGQWIPAFTGRRVVYGHPYETIHAYEEKAWVLSVFKAGGYEAAQALTARGIEIVYYGPREQELSSNPDWPGFEPAYHSGDVTIFAAQRNQ